MVSAFFFMVISVVVISFLALYVLYQILLNFQPSSVKLKKDFNVLKKSTESLPGELVPWDKEEIELLSTNRTGEKSRNLLWKSGLGQFTSIYDEALIKYAYRSYIAPGENGLLLAKTSKHEYGYRVSRKGVRVKIDGVNVGSIDNNGVFRNTKKKEIGNILMDEKEASFQVQLNGKGLGGVTNIKKSEQLKPRAFQLLVPMDAETEKYFLAIGIYGMYKQFLSFK